MSSPVTLRPAQSDDECSFVSLLIELIGPLWRLEYPDDTNIDEKIDRLADEYDADQTCIVLLEDERVGAVQTVNGARAVAIKWLLIAPEYQRQGIGTSVVRLIQDDARAHDRQVRLEVLNCNSDAHRLYERLGFQTIALLPHVVWMAWHPAGPRAYAAIDLRRPQ